ncbi:tyrosine-type recombinase/integrase [Streptomyces atratus]
MGTAHVGGGSSWGETGRVFTRENGQLLHPANVTRRFGELCEEIGLPPIRLHDLRHGAATLAHAAGVGLKDIQEMLGHSSITITSDTCTSLLPETDPAIAEAADRLVPRTRASFEDTGPGAGAQPDEADESVPDDADPLGDIREISSPSAHANGPGRGVRGRIERLLEEKPQVSGVSRCAPGRIRTCGTRFRSFSWRGGDLCKCWAWWACPGETLLCSSHVIAGFPNLMCAEFVPRGHLTERLNLAGSPLRERGVSGSSRRS